jgi:hypothetical protein
MFVGFYIVILYICVLMTCSTSYWLYDTFIDPWNVCVYVCVYMYVYVCIMLYVCVCVYFFLLFCMLHYYEVTLHAFLHYFHTVT